MISLDEKQKLSKAYFSESFFIHMSLGVIFLGRWASIIQETLVMRGKSDGNPTQKTLLVPWRHVWKLGIQFTDA